ncbi:LuxR C-terminal-related transcriptional regulator, partial [Conexibacter sp. JD483]|uniref:LuxR C-terminal-related transcriptional regulator n=1 Tax=Conexibacter sp. JD483 TaxID=3064471 RepID=UPI00286FB40D
ADALLGAALTPAARGLLGARAVPGAEARADARLLTVLAYVALQEQRLDEAERLLALAWECDDADDGVRRKIAERRTVLALARLRPHEALTWARRVAPLVPAGPERELSRWTEAIAHGAAGDHRAALEILDQALSVGETLVSDFGIRAMRGRFRLGADDVAGALDDLRTAAAAESRLGSESFKAAVHAWLAEALQASGAWEAAALEIEQALALLFVADNVVTRMEVNRAAGAMAVARGDLAEAEEQLRQLREPASNPRGDLTVAIAAATLAAAHGRPEQVLAELEPFSAAAPADPLLPQLRADALIRLGRLDEADAVLTRERARTAADAAETTPCSRQVTLLRLRGRLEAARGDHAAADALFATALAAAERLPLPYELALAQLDRGRSLRRQGQRKEGAALLQLARDRFAALGAAPLLEQCERELAASGLQPARRGDADRSALTARERAVAQLAAAGLTNRAIAAELMVSAKTVEVHLSRVFAKLGISARTELAEHL